MYYLLNKKRKAFTVVEVLIAATIFSMFLIGVFSLFNMGSRMYITGSWKYNKQKEGERFLQVLKERIEQASVPARIIKNGEQITIEKAGNIAYFVNKNEEIYVKNLGEKRYISEFIVSKVDKSSTSTASEGLILNHCLYCEPQNNGLAKLCLYVNSNNTDSNYKSVSYFDYKFPPDDFGGNFRIPYYSELTVTNETIKYQVPMCDFTKRAKEPDNPSSWMTLKKVEIKNMVKRYTVTVRWSEKEGDPREQRFYTLSALKANVRR